MRRVSICFRSDRGSRHLSNGAVAVGSVRLSAASPAEVFFYFDRSTIRNAIRLRMVESERPFFRESIYDFPAAELLEKKIH